MTNTRNESGNIITYPMEIKRIKNSMNNSMPTDLITQMKWANSLKDNLPKHTQEETDDLNRYVSIKEIESIINNLQKQTAPGPDVFVGEFNKH